jgi:hypothetical protein
MFFSEVTEEYKNYLKIDNVIDEKTVNLTSEIVLGFTEVGMLLNNELITDRLILILPNESVVKVIYDKVPYRIRPHVPKVEFFKIFYENNCLKIRGINTCFNIPVADKNFRIDDIIVIGIWDNQIVIRCD